MSNKKVMEIIIFFIGIKVLGEGYLKGYLKGSMERFMDTIFKIIMKYKKRKIYY